jgi:hypothetical protein
VLESVITRYEDQKIAIKAGGRLFDKFSDMKQQVQAMKKSVENTDDKRENTKKNDFKRMS